MRSCAAAALAATLIVINGPARESGLLAQADPNQIVPAVTYKDMRWRMVGASRGGRVTGMAGAAAAAYLLRRGHRRRRVEDRRRRHHLGAVGDGQITTGSIGSIDVAPSNPDHIWVGTGSAAIRSNVIIGRGIFKSTDAGKSFQFAGMRESGQVGGIRVHPTNPDIVWAAALGTPYGPSDERGIFSGTSFAHPLQGLWARLVDLRGIYTQPMLISQLQNIARMVGQADQKLGKDAVDRYNDLMMELQAVQTAFKQSGGTTLER
jgi:hypothetical protein